MLRNNGDIPRAWLQKYLDTKIVFQGADQVGIDLRSQRTGEELIAEEENIDPSTLSNSLWIPEIYTFNSPLTRETIAKITQNTGGLFKFSETSPEATTDFKYGWLVSADYDPDARQCEFKILRANTLSPNLVIKDPEGNTPETPPNVPEPSLYEGVFEGPFPFILQLWVLQK